MTKTPLPTKEVQAIWQLACEDLKLQLTPAAFSTWVLTNPLTEIFVDSNNKATCVISTPTAFHATNLKKNLYAQLKTAIQKALNKPIIDLQFRITDFSQIISQAKQKKATPFSSAAKSVQQTRKDLLKTNSLPRNQSPNQSFSPAFPQQKPQHRQNFSPTVGDLFSAHSIQSANQDRAFLTAKAAGLKIDYTFKSFAVSGSNEMAHAAATAVSKRPGQAYNPLFLYGGVGVGKTHLMHAIGHNILQNNPNTKTIYCTGEDFTNEIVSAIQTKKAINFKQKFRNAKVLLIDDIQFIAGKNAVQEEFFHTFNALIQNNAQIVLTSDRPPQEINLLEDRLKSRFQAGLMIDIQQPSLELRTAIVLIKTQANHLDVPMDLAQQIADKVHSARKIEGVITKIRSEVELKGRVISEKLIEEILAKEAAQTRQLIRIKPANLIKKVSSFYGFKPIAVKGKKRNKDLVKARHVAMYIMKQELNISYVEIGRWFSNRDHTSVIHAYEKIERLLKEDNFIQEDLTAIKISLV